MPALCNRRGKKLLRGKVTVKGKTKTKWFEGGKKGSRQYRDAVLWEEKTRKSLEAEVREREKETTPLVSLTIRDWGNAYMGMVKRRRASSTLTEVKTAFRHLTKSFDPDMEISKLTPAKALEHLDIQNDRRTGSAANNDRKNLAAAWKWARTFLEGFPQTANPFRRIEKYPINRKDRYVPPEEDFWKVMGVVSGQDEVMLTAFLHLGARRGEIFRLQWADIDFPTSRVRLSTKKTKDGSFKYDWIPMTQELKSKLLWLWENRKHKHSSHVFTVGGDGSCENQYEGSPFAYRGHFMKKACIRAGVKPFGFHAIRHLTAVILYQAGYPVAMIQAILRHERATTTEVYLKRLGYEPEKLKDVVSVFEDRAPAKVIPLTQNTKAPDQKMTGS